MRSPPSLLTVMSMLAITGCMPDGTGSGSGALTETSECRLAGSGAIGADSFGGDVHDESGSAAGGWSHVAPGGALEGAPDALFCRINGSIVADVDGHGSWNGVPGHVFRLHVQDRGTQTSERVAGTPGTVSVTATRTYRPDHATDGAADWAEGADVTVPASIAVTVGNGGHGTVELTLVEHDSGEPIRCTYASSARGTAYALVSCARMSDDDDDGHHGHGRGHDSHGRGWGWGHLRHGCRGDGWAVDPSIVAGSVIEASSVELHVVSGSDRHPSRRDARTTVVATLSVTPYVLETVGEPDFYRLAVWGPDGSLVYSRSGDLTSGDLTISLLE